MNGNLQPVPTIDELVADPGKIQELPAQVAQHVVIQITALLPALVAKSRSTPEQSQEDRLIKIDEAAPILGMSKDRLYRHDFPFTIRDGGSLRFSYNGIQRWIKARLR